MSDAAQTIRVGVEATSLLGRRSGIGHTTASLIEALAATGEVDLVLVPLSVRGARQLPQRAPRHERIEALKTRIPARLAEKVWAKATWPPIELFAGPLDVFHGPNFVMPAMLKAAGVMTVHDVGFVSHRDYCSAHTASFAEKVPRWTQRAQRIIVPSQAVAGELSEWLPDTADRIRVVHHGIRDVFVRPGGPLGEPRLRRLGITGSYVMFTGNLEVRKNVDVLLESFAKVRSAMPDAQLVLAGAPGVGWTDIATRHATMLDSPSVLMPGYVPDVEMAALMRGAAAFVYPSLYEGFGLPPLEAMSCRTPVIASDIAVLREVLGDHATFVDPANVSGLADAMLERLGSPALESETQAAVDFAHSYTWERTANATLQVYREAVGV